MSPEELQAIHDKLDELIRMVRNVQHEGQRHGAAIAELQKWRGDQEAGEGVAGE